jgi:pilus assembly protein FimV
MGGLWVLRRRRQMSADTGEPLAPAADEETPEAAATADEAHTAGTAPGNTTSLNPGAFGTSSSSGPFITASAAAAPVVPLVPTVSNVTDIVDPIDEARVYLEHQQNDQAEKILREALSKQPGREDIQMVLLEILAESGDKDGFNQLAGRLHKQTGGAGGRWKRAMALGYALDPAYPLYSPPEEAVVQSTPVAFDANPAATSLNFDTDSAAPTPEVPNSTTDIRLPAEDASESQDATLEQVAAVEPPAAAAAPLPDLDFELPPTVAPPAEVPEVPALSVQPNAPDDAGLDFKVDFSTIEMPKPDSESANTDNAPVATDPAREAVQEKIVLARAYREMGDKAGALELLREVEREGDAAQQAEAQKLLQAAG